jgi:hypothetical protein
MLLQAPKQAVTFPIEMVNEICEGLPGLRAMTGTELVSAAWHMGYQAVALGQAAEPNLRRLADLGCSDLLALWLADLMKSLRLHIKLSAILRVYLSADLPLALEYAAAARSLPSDELAAFLGHSEY